MHREAIPTSAEPIQSILDRALSRRAVLQGAAAGATLVIVPGALAACAAADAGGRLRFATVPPGDGTERDVRVPPNYEFDVVLRWGDPLSPGAPAFVVDRQTGARQAQQFGFNADLILFYPLPDWLAQGVAGARRLGKQLDAELGERFPALQGQPTDRALLAVNHEYTTGADMFPGYDRAQPTRDQVEAEIAAHGLSIVELRRDRRGRWALAVDSVFNRRVTGTTAHEITGPLRGHERMKTAADPTGTVVLGCFNNCGGGRTPWGTVLSCEENFDQYFANFGRVAAEHRRLSERIAAAGGESARKWERFDARFDLAADANEYHRFGWVVELDPYDPSDTPKKRTALGRFKHEGAACRVTGDQRVAVYSGDDARFEHVFKFVSEGRYDPRQRARNKQLLDAGTLYAARFDAGETAGDDLGTGAWLPLVWESGNALDRAGFKSQAEVLIDARGAADVLGATPMDRPEDIEVEPRTGAVYIALTNNTGRAGAGSDERTENGRRVGTAPDEANPRNDTFDDGDPGARTGNEHGHVIELREDGDDAGALTFRWNIFLRCGDPAIAAHGARFGDVQDPVAAGISPIADPDNLVHDDDGNLWIATDGMTAGGGAAGFGQNDGVFAVPVDGKGRGVLRQFLSGVPGCEVCGPEFSGDNRTFFCAIQHPHEGRAFAAQWPAGEPRVARPGVIAVREKQGRKIGY